MSRFKKVSADDVIKMLKGRRYRYAQVHHTWKPNHNDFTGSNHISLQQGMYNYHVNTNGWSDIGQHLTLFPDGTFVTGRNFSTSPAGISGYNSGAFMIEIIGDFDKGRDKLKGNQLKSALKIYNYLINHCGASILFHNEKAAKSCPGTGISKSKFVSAVRSFNGNTKTVSVESSGSTRATSKWIKITGNWNGSPLLKRGQYGAPVKKMQNLLRKKGYLKASQVDTYFGGDTESALEKFQRDSGLSIDGLGGKNTYKALKKKGKANRAKWVGTKNKGKELIVTGSLVNYYDTQRWSNPSGGKPNGFKWKIDNLYKVNGSLQYRVQDADGNLFYTTGRSDLVKVGGIYKGDGVAYSGANLEVDGKAGSSTIEALQRALGTTVDGVISGQYSNNVTNAFYGGITFGTKGSTVVRALQKKIGAKVDGFLGVDTIKKLQQYLGTTVDGVLSRPSTVIKELQRRLNAGTF